MSSPLKVLYLLHDSRRSGVPAVLAAVIRSLDRSRVTPVVRFAYEGPYASELRETGVEVGCFGKRRPFVWRAYRFLFNIELLRLARQIDVVHVSSTKLAFSVLVAKWLKLPVIYHLHELPSKKGFVLRKAMQAADCVVFCSKSCESHFTEVPAARKETLVNTMFFPDRPRVAHRSSCRKVVALASLNKNKGQDLLLRAFARLRNRDAELWLYGTTGLSAHGFVRELKRFAEENGIGNRVFFPGPTADVSGILSDAAILAHPSLTESFGMALVEAMSCGVPVVSHNRQGMREVVEDGVTGFLVEPGMVDQLAARIDELLDDPALRDRMGEAGYRLMRERYDVSSRVPEYERLYEEVAGR